MHEWALAARTELEKEDTILKYRACGKEWAFGDALEELSEDKREFIHFVPEIAHTYIACPECRSCDFQFVKGRGVLLYQRYSLAIKRY